MSNPKISTITDVFLPDGYGSFQYGAGQYGGYSDLLNPQWNTDSGLYYIDPVSGLPAVEATSAPSFVGATVFDAVNSAFFAKIVPAAAPGTQTALVIKTDARNYVEMSVGPNGLFTIYGVNNNNVVYTASPAPAYDPTAHAFWRIRNDSVLFHFEVSPDAITWTELGNVSYTWDASAVTVVFLVGFNGIQAPGFVSLISSVNVAPGLTLSTTTHNTTGSTGNALVTSPYSLSGSAGAVSGLRADFNVTLGIPRGGLTDLSFSSGYGNTIADPMFSTLRGFHRDAPWTGGPTFSSSSWSFYTEMASVPTTYRDGSYWQPAAYMSPYFDANATGTINTASNVISAASVIPATGLNNRLSINSSIYTQTCPYTANQTNNFMQRSAERSLGGLYSGKLTYGPSNATIGTGQTAYWALPTRASMVPVHHDGSGNQEGFIGTVYVNTSRANTNWFASLVFYDANFNLLTGTTYLQATITNMNVHPGGNTWQQGTVTGQPIASGAAWVGIVPVIIAPSPQVTESVYVSGHSLVTLNMSMADLPTRGAYEPPRQSNIVVKADRVNYMINSGFNTAVTNWATFVTLGISGSPNPLTFAWDGTVGRSNPGSLKSTVVPISGTFTGSPTDRIGPGTPGIYSGGISPNIEGLKIGHTYTISAYVLRSVNCPDVAMHFTDTNFIGTDYISVNTAASNGFIEQGGWVRVSTTFTIPYNCTPTFRLWFSVLVGDITGHAPFNFWIDDILVEESNQLLPYFDGSFGGTDYQWEGGPTNVNFSRSHYYNDYANKVTRLNAAIPSVLPLGETYSLTFAQTPVYP